jgi:steroid delta-isomerase-like uncharacterized protein
VALPERSKIDVLAARWVAAWTSDGDFAGCCSAEVSYEDPLAPEPQRGLDALAAHAMRLREAFPDVRVELTAPALHRGENACFAWRLAGTHRGTIALLPATDRSVTLHGVHYVELTDGRIARARGFFDLYDGATQLGLLPARGGLGETALMLLRGFGLRR